MLSLLIHWIPLNVTVFVGNVFYTMWLNWNNFFPLFYFFYHLRSHCWFNQYSTGFSLYTVILLDDLTQGFTGGTNTDAQRSGCQELLESLVWAWPPSSQIPPTDRLLHFARWSWPSVGVGLISAEADWRWHMLGILGVDSSSVLQVSHSQNKAHECNQQFYE